LPGGSARAVAGRVPGKARRSRAAQAAVTGNPDARGAAGPSQGNGEEPDRSRPATIMRRTALMLRPDQGGGYANRTRWPERSRSVHDGHAQIVLGCPLGLARGKLIFGLLSRGFSVRHNVRRFVEPGTLAQAGAVAPCQDDEAQRDDEARPSTRGHSEGCQIAGLLKQSVEVAHYRPRTGRCAPPHPGVA